MRKMQRRGLSAWPWMWLWLWFITAILGTLPSEGHTTSKDELIGGATPTPSSSLTTLPSEINFTKKRYNASIFENSIGKTYVTPEERIGIQLSSSAFRESEIRYRIVGGDRDKFFKAEERTVGDFCFLLLRTRTNNNDVLNRERKDRYVLLVHATAIWKDIKNKSTAGVLETETTVVVTILDTNDLNPLFFPTEYKETVTEDTPLHQSILRVVAEDADLGRNGEIYYSFAEESEQFAVHPISGVITLTRPLRYSERPLHELIVLAEDRESLFRGFGTRSSRASTAPVTIKVQQVNLYAPEIYVNHLPDVVENSNADIYAIVRVVDRDEGVHGEISSLEIVGGDPDGHFRIKSGQKQGEYRIEIVDLLDRETARQGYNLSLRAIDRGTPQRFSHKIVPVHLTDVNDNAPIFSREIYDVSVPETAPVNTPVIRLKVTDADEGKNSLVSLEIVGGNEGGEFHVNAETGMLYTAVPLDAETKTLYTLTVSAVDQGNTGTRKQSSAKVKINIIDANDNDPIFDKSELSVEIDENKPAGTNVIKVTARDKDSGENAYISYSIDNIEKVPFEIDPFSGLIKTKQILDYETMKRDYVLVVRASDWGLPYRRQTEMQLRIKLRDVNDNRPQFEKVDCLVRVPRYIAIGSEIMTVSAIDLDTGNIINYRIDSSNEDTCFSLDSVTGVLSVVCDLTDLPVSDIYVNVTATDGTHFADLNIISVQLINVKKNNNAAIDSDKAIGSAVGSFTCHDTGVAKRLTDSIELAERNNQPAHEDRYPYNALTPRRYGGNVHAPEFIDFPNEIKVNESVKLGTELVKIHAKDRDLDYNGRLVFGISSGDLDSVFGIDQETGHLTTTGYLDRERESEYFLNITVYDLGKPQMSVSRMLPITVLDVNDNAPKFDKPLASLKISENTMNGTIVYVANATDADLGENAQVSYSLVTDTDEFRIDPITGVLSVFGRLDRERQDVYELKIRASDNPREKSPDDNSLSLYTDALIRITIEDVNDNSPKFALSSYSVKIREDVPVWCVVAVVEATDPDEGAGSEIEYVLSDTMDNERYFKIDPISGTIRTTQRLDFEQRQVHTLNIIAKDNGEPSLSSETMLIIEVVDVNENLYPPTFEDSIVSASVLENQPVGTHVTTVRAKDNDPVGPDSKIGYSIHGGDGIGLFAIDEEGNVRTRAVLDAESKNGYWLTIYAQDHGIVPLSSQLLMYIEVLDENDNTPLTELPVYYTSVLENSPADVSILQIKAFDRDVPPQEFSFSIRSGNPEGYFLINSTTGLITTSGRKLDRENQAEHVMEVTLRDDGTPSLSSTTRIVVQVDDINDHGPEFEQKYYTARIPASFEIDKPLFQKSRNRSWAFDLSIDSDALLENGTWETYSPDTLIGDRIFRVLANDKDVGENGKIQYTIKGGRGKGKFRIHPSTGMVYSQKGYEAGQEYEMLIRASDNGEPQRSHQTRVSVQVVEAPKDSKYPPVFKANNQTAAVTESDQVGFLVGLLQATDKDGDTLWYDIVGGDSRDEFFIGRDNGNVLLAKSLDWEKQNFYNLTILVTDGIFNSTTQLLVTVIDINDHRPEFSQSIYKIEISENVEKGETVLQLEASDRDEDKKIFYSLHTAQNQQSLDIFNVDSITGEVTLNGYLDRETIEEHILTVMVRDQGTPAKRNYARIIITVHDHNDHAPEFISGMIQGKVFETSPIGTAVVQIYAIDRDRGDNARITYSITSGNVGNVFSIDPELGIIRVSRDLDLGAISEYILLVKATDHGSPPRTNTVPVDIVVTMADNAPPRFIQQELAAEIYENQQAGTYVKHVEVRSTSSLQFQLIDGNKDDEFFVNPTTGVITTKNRLDYEKKKFYNLTLSATNMAGVSSTSSIIIHVLDRNDNAPRFLQATYNGEISEGAVIGSIVLTNSSSPLVIKAEDADSELNALLSYDIVEDLPRKFFHIDSSTGAISTVMLLDHETIPKFKFHVKVSDLGKPKLSSETTAKVIISVTDINDCPPKFTQAYYNTTLLLPTYKNVKIVQVDAIDLDSIKGVPLRYDIIEGNENKTFQIDPLSGVITIGNPNDMRDTYQLHVRVSDGKYSSTTQVNVNVEESENSGLVFQTNVNEGSIMENSTKIMTVAVVNVLGSALNEHIIFSILNPTDMFEIGSTSGVIRTVGKRFDREVKDHYELVVEAKSHALDREKPRVVHVIVNVTILDINDNCPIFVNLPYYAVISVDAQKGSVITKIHAIDMDSGDNGEVRYELKKGHGELFKVSRKTGEISLKQNLEGHNREYQLTISAYDGGLTPCSVEVPVNVKVIDRSMPTFDKQFYTANVLESAEIDTPLSLSIQAKSDLDRKLIYSISKGNDFEEFALNFNTAPDNNNGPCTIYVADVLDYEQKKQYELTVRATDSISGVFAEVLVSILVQDVNDCPPEFSQDSYNISISEAASFGTSLIKVNARDNDTEINQEVIYTIENDTESSNEYFHIDPNEGIIYLKRSLDHEIHESHHFTIIATDRGIPPLSSTSHIWVTVIDMNDNPPKFEQPSYTCSLSEEAERDQFVTIVSASDPDDSEEKLTYTIVGGNDQQTYSIDPSTGIIKLINMQNFGDQKLTTLNISVTDGVYTSFTRVKIEILPANKHTPKFPNPLIEITVMENQLPGRLVTTVRALDDDFGEYGNIVYSIPSELMHNIFDINSVSGEITTKKKLDRELKNFYEIPVMATDDGGKSSFVIVRVKVGDENDNPPIFLLQEYRASVHSNTSINIPFMKVKAFDIDELESADIEYSIYEPQNSEVQNFFDINPSTGAISLIKNAVPIENQFFEFFIRATDKGPSPLHADVPFSVYIMSPNDVPPLFERKEDKFFISEASPIDTPITRLKTVIKTNATIKYRLVSGSIETPVFQISDQGQITLRQYLDRELKDNHLIAVLAETDSSPPLTSLAEISLQVLDENDHAPEFESNPYSITVAENIHEGASIIKVIAHDEDLGSNSDIRYSFGTDIGELANIFTVDTYTGWISTLVQLDKEKQSEYKFQVVATDNGNPKHFARTMVLITLKDYNDNSPTFTSKHYKAQVKEDDLPGTVVVKLMTLDKDSDLNTPVEFYIVSGDPRSQFQVRPTGEIYVAKSLDREIVDEYELNVIGTDGKFVFDTKITVQVQDVNDNPPYCLHYRYREVLSEGTHPGTYVLTVLATDYDDQSNSKLRFYLTDDNDNGNNNEKFSLDKDTGVLKTNGQLDRETQSRYSLTAHVQDREKTFWECSSQLVIHVSDLNDNPPIFTMASYNSALPEDVKIGTLVGKVHATDKDIGINRKVRYEFVDSADGHFIISSESGIVTLAKPLDRETKEMYNLTIKAIDQGTPQLFSTATLIVDVQDINDNPPEFVTKSYFASVPEVDQIGTEVARVVAISKDTGVNALVFYSIVGGNEHRKFDIDNNTGIIKIAEQLDYERARDYFLTIQAIDGGIPPLRNYATVNITVTDCNDNAPSFNQVLYRSSIREDAKIGEHVTQVSANDLDSGENGNVTYSIERGDRLKQFKINKITGVITVNYQLDREAISSYVLEVHARDGGQPVLESFVVVNIEIFDANDNPPIFSKTNYTTVIQEDKATGYALMKFIVTDADIAPNAEPYTFDFRSGNEGDAFRLEQDGTLRTAIKFNSRVKDQYVLHIRVFDNGSQPLYSDTWVLVKVIEESQYPPSITPLEIIINSYNDEYPGGIIGKIHASDRDQYDTLQYNIESLLSPKILSDTDLFQIDKNNGSIIALPRLDVGEYRINVSVSDGKFVSYTIMEINVELIDENMLDNSVIIRFREVTPENFILSHRKLFLRILRNAMNCRPKDIIIIGIQASIDEPNSSKSRAVRQIKKQTRQSIHNDLDLIFSVRKSNSVLDTDTSFFSSESIREALNHHIEELEESTKLVVEEIVKFKCNSKSNNHKAHCINGECRDKIIVDQSQVTISTDVMSFVSSTHKHKIECNCKLGYAGEHCETIINECAKNPCQSFKICVPDSSTQGYSCQCPEGLSGPTCDKDISKCHDQSCYVARKPISFSGKSYAAYKIDKAKKREAIEDRLSFSLRIRTVQPTGNLMYAAGPFDYNILEIVNGAAQYKFDLGSGEGLVRVNSVYISDGHWHEIQLERESNNAKLTVDAKHVAHGSAPGINDILNLQSDDFYLGAEVRQHPGIIGFEDIQRGFIGCMDDVRIDKVSVPLHMSGVASSVAILKRFANVEFSCDTSIILVQPGICGSQPCQNGGTCKETENDGMYQCHCHARYKGIVCEIDTTPCASAPCLFGGRCKPLSDTGDYVCDCIGPGLTGKRCEFGRYCGSNPCYNNGRCEEGNNGPICKCHGFVGERCETDFDECTSNPCLNGGTCVNEIGTYRCICPTTMTGLNCAHPFFSTSIISEHLKITWEQLTWIGIALIANFILIIILITCRKARNKRTRARTNNINNETRKQIVLNSARPNDHEFKRTSKLSNLEVIQREPPQCPPRPASYTPSSNNEPATYGNSAAVALNNLDTLRSYGSAGDELENFPPDYLRNLNRSTPVPNPTLALSNTGGGNTTPSDTDSLHKPIWQEQMLASFISDTAKIKNDLKRTSPDAPELTTGGRLLNSTRRTPHVGGTSVASLSSIEDDPRIVGGYHWDCSDWVRPSQNPLPNITEVPGSEVPDSSSFHSNESNESNTHHLPPMHGQVDPSRDISMLNEDQDSEYVGQSGYGTDYSEQYHCPEAQRLNPLDSGGEGEYKYKDTDSYHIHPNSYLPHYNIHTDTENEMNPLNGRLSALESDEEEDDVVPYGFPSMRRNRCKGNDIDDIGSVITTLEERNSLLGGATSNSDLSTNLCEIDDSEYEINEEKVNGRIWLPGNGVKQSSV